MKCSKCGSEMCFLEKYCWKCGEKAQTSVPLKAYEEDKDKFAFHAEYYGNLNMVDTSYSHYDGHIYFFNGYKNRLTKVCTENGILTEIPTDESITDVLLHYAKIYVNSQGIFLKEKNKYVLLSHDGKKIGFIDFDSLLKEGESIGNTYIYDSKLYVSVSGKKDSNITIAEYDILDNNRCHELWKFDDIEAELTDMFLQQCRCSHDEKVKWKTTFDEEDFRVLECKYVYANMKNLIFRIFFLQDNGDISRIEDFIIIYKIDTGEWESLCIGDRCNNIRFDMLHNLMWIVNDDKKIECASIQTVYDIKEFRKNILEERCWHNCSKRSWTDRINDCYFDGEIAIYPESYCSFYVFNQDGSCDEWNQSGHGGADWYIVLGEWIKVGLDCLFYDKGLTFFPLQQKLAPENKWLVVTEEMLNVDEGYVTTESNEADTTTELDKVDIITEIDEADTIMEPEYCIYCGEKLIKDARFCILCGEKVWRK